MASTMKYDRLRRLAELEKERLRRKEETESVDTVRENALKFYKGSGPKLEAGLNVSPVTELHAYEAYLEELRFLRSELEEKYRAFPEFRRVSWWLDREISTVLEGIVKISIQITAEGRMV